MVRGQVLCIWLLLLLLQRCRPGGAQLIVNTDAAYIEGIVNEHNRFRSQVSPHAADMLYMSWDEDLAKTAHAWASMCSNFHNPWLQLRGMGHPTFSLLGENLWITNTSSTGGVHAGLADYELDFCNFTVTLSEQQSKCLPLLQVAWARTYKVGCGSALCKRVLGLPGEHTQVIRVMVCNYAPAGNIQGQLPYTEGPGCSSCPAGDTCEKNLCRNATRDAVASSSWTPPWRCHGCSSGTQPVSVCSALLLLASVSLYYVT